MATSNVIKEFSQDGVYYLELRTTPRQIEASMTYEEYLDAVVRGIEYENQLFLGLLKFRYFFSQLFNGPILDKLSWAINTK